MATTQGVDDAILSGLTGSDQLTIGCGSFGIVCQAEVDETNQHQTTENQRQQLVVIDHGDQTQNCQRQSQGWCKWEQGRGEGALEFGLALAQLEQGRHRDDVHDDGAEHRHGDDIGGQRHTTDDDQ